MIILLLKFTYISSSHFAITSMFNRRFNNNESEFSLLTDVKMWLRSIKTEFKLLRTTVYVLHSQMNEMK